MDPRPSFLSQENKEKKLDIIRKKVEKITDELGKPVEPGIKETVVMFNAFGLPTTGSCEGHIDSHKEGYSPEMAPWIEILPQEPEQEDWKNDNKLREKVREENKKHLSKIVDLLNEFYKNQEVPDDIKLVIDHMDYGFKVQSSGLEGLKDPNDKGQQERAIEYKREMEKFTAFLKEKFLKL